MIIDGMDFHDGLSAVQGRENLWRAVLMNAIEEAVFGISRSNYGSLSRRAAMIKDARDYVTIPNKDFDMVCSLAGLDPEAVRERVARRIAEAPTPEALVSAPRKPRNTQREKGTRKPRMDVVRHDYNGMNLTIGEWSRHTGIPPMTIRQRLAAGWPISRAIQKVDGRTTRHRAKGKRPAKGWRAPGVSFDFAPSKGTGARGTAQETPNITFSGNEA